MQPIVTDVHSPSVCLSHGLINLATVCVSHSVQLCQILCVLVDLVSQPSVVQDHFLEVWHCIIVKSDILS